MLTVENLENRKKVTRRFSVLSDSLVHLSPVLPDRPIPPAFFLSSQHPLDVTEQKKAFIHFHETMSLTSLACTATQVPGRGPKHTVRAH